MCGLVLVVDCGASTKQAIARRTIRGRRGRILLGRPAAARAGRVRINVHVAPRAPARGSAFPDDSIAHLRQTAACPSGCDILRKNVTDM
jgi:hypothetical protein